MIDAQIDTLERRQLDLLSAIAALDARVEGLRLRAMRLRADVDLARVEIEAAERNTGHGVT